MYFDYQILNDKKKKSLFHWLESLFYYIYLFGFSQFQIIFINVNQSPKLIIFEGAYKLTVSTCKIKEKTLFLDDLPKELPLRWQGSLSLYITLLIIMPLTTANLDIRWNWQLPMQWQPFNSQITLPLKSTWSSKYHFAKLFILWRIHLKKFIFQKQIPLKSTYILQINLNY